MHQRREPRRRGITFLAAFALAGACAAPATSVAPRGELTPPAPLVPRPRAIDVEHYAIDVALDPLARTIDARCRVRFWPARGVGELKRVELDLDALRVSSVRDRAGAELRFEQRGETLAVELATPLRAGAFEELDVRYAGAPRRGLWFVDVEDGRATQVFTQGECEDAHGWFPCIDDPADRATTSVRVTMPAGWRSLAAGRRVESTSPEEPGELGGRTSETWRMDFPHPPYLVTLVAGEFVEHIDEWDGVPLVHLADEDHAPMLDAALARTKDVLAFFSQLTGARYPYPKYGQACVADFPFGGMENISATTLTDTALGDERARRDGTADGLVAHEAAHQWFGDLLTCADWSHIWLNEGFATYFTALWTEHDEGADAYREQIVRLHDAVLERDVGPARRPVVWNVCRRPMDLFFTGHVYQGGAARLHHLRAILGDDAFFRGIARYVGENRGRSVVTDDLRRALEETSGVDLKRFFEQWLLSPGHPRLATSWTWDGDTKRVRLRVRQTHTADAGVPAVFESPVDVELALPPGRSGKVELQSRRVQLSSREQVFELECSARPLWVNFDARDALLADREDAKEPKEWLAILRQCDAPGLRRDALRALAKLARTLPNGEQRDGIEVAFRDVARTDRSALVRQTAIEALGGSTQSETLEALRASASADARSAVRVAALRALATRGRDPELASFATQQIEGGWSWATMSAAMRLSASAQPDGAFERLQEARATDSPHGTYEAQLIDVLAPLDDPRVAPELERTASDRGERSLVRAAAAAALARFVLAQRTTTDVLLALLDDADHRVRRAAAVALGKSREERVRVRLVQQHARSVVAHERRAIEDALDARRKDVE